MLVSPGAHTALTKKLYDVVGVKPESGYGLAPTIVLVPVPKTKFPKPYSISNWLAADVQTKSAEVLVRLEVAAAAGVGQVGVFSTKISSSRMSL